MVIVKATHGGLHTNGRNHYHVNHHNTCESDQSHDLHLSKHGGHENTKSIQYDKGSSSHQGIHGVKLSSLHHSHTSFPLLILEIDAKKSFSYIENIDTSFSEQVHQDLVSKTKSLYISLRDLLNLINTYADHIDFPKDYPDTESNSDSTDSNLVKLNSLHKHGALPKLPSILMNNNNPNIDGVGLGLKKPSKSIDRGIQKNTISRGMSSNELTSIPTDAHGIVDSTSNADATNINSDEYYAVNTLRLRDLRRLDFHFNPIDEPNIIVRRHVLLMSFDPIRALIMADRLLLIVPDGADNLLKILEDYMEEWKVNPDLSHIPFESHVLEALFTTINALQVQDFEIVKKEVDAILIYFRKGAILPVVQQEKMQTLKNTVTAMKSRILGHKRVLLELMEDDEVMCLMNLTKLKRNPNLYMSPLKPEILATHEDVEELLETYLMDYNLIQSKLEKLQIEIQSAEELVSLRLDTSRNELLIVNTQMAVLACCIGFAAFITGAFGMNLDNTIYLQYVPNLFYTICAVCVGFIIFSYYLTITYYRETGVLPKKANKKKAVLKKVL